MKITDNLITATSEQDSFYAELSGFEIRITRTSAKSDIVSPWLCGYVLIPESHPWHGVHYTHKHFRKIHRLVIGGLTFSGKLDGEDGWWIGFDCSHAFCHIDGSEGYDINEAYHWTICDFRRTLKYVAHLAHAAKHAKNSHFFLKMGALMSNGRPVYWVYRFGGKRSKPVALLSWFNREWRIVEIGKIEPVKDKMKRVERRGVIDMLGRHFGVAKSEIELGVIK